MIIHEFINSRNKKITIKLSNISDLFFYNADLYIKAFNISKSEFQNIKNFKTRYDGYYIKIKQNDELAAFFTLREFKINSYELGDLVKIKKLFHREDLAKGIKYTNDYILEKNQNATFIGYPNELALKVELDAGYKIYSYYKKRISLIFCNFVLSLPILISNKKIEFDSKFLSRKQLSFNNNLNITSKKIFKIFNVYKKNNNFAKIKPINLFGFLIEYTITNEGFPIIFYSKDKSLFKKEYVAFENSDHCV